ncbi:ferritin-like domain-containing protein [Streptomyces sp. NBC_01485]|uniref:ferritin-like domain-containing protein n=1 Tax=Streptomyces sp. NBC_01485 TaxID=2903884 RepID=UPI002E340BB2|nr:ferritin-like domain-containing protein [Streptomyces sp. NBC_01485]
MSGTRHAPDAHGARPPGPQDVPPGTEDAPPGSKSAPSRRSLVLGAAGAVLGAAGIGVGLALHADGGSHHAPSPYSGDLRTVALAAALENQAVSAYQAVDAALRAGRLGPAVPALAEFVRTATAHHTQHAATWNAILREAHKPVVTGAPLSGHAQLMKRIKAASTVAEVVSAVQGLEYRAAQTHTAAAGSLTGTGPAVVAAATIAPVEAMHAATLGYVLGGPSGTASFLGMSEALRTTELTA